MIQRIREMEPSQRPRERLLEYGPSVLSDAELIAVLLRTGRSGSSAVMTAQEILARAGGLVEVARLAAEELVRYPGLGEAKATTLIAAFELGKRLSHAEINHGAKLDRPETVGVHLVRQLKAERQEIFGFLSLDSHHRLVKSHTLTVGTRNQAPVDAMELFRRALLDEAAGLLLFHNHPSEVLDPSRDDMDLTRRLVKAGVVVGVPVLDHLIVAGARWLSLRSAKPQLFS
jgi:DNA repair protein RadC